MIPEVYHRSCGRLGDRLQINIEYRLDGVQVVLESLAKRREDDRATGLRERQYEAECDRPKEGRSAVATTCEGSQGPTGMASPVPFQRTEPLRRSKILPALGGC